MIQLRSTIPTGSASFRVRFVSALKSDGSHMVALPGARCASVDPRLRQTVAPQNQLFGSAPPRAEILEKL